MRTYLNQLQQILDHAVEKRDRTGMGTLSLLGMPARYAMDDGFPAVTTKRLVTSSPDLLYPRAFSNRWQRIHTRLQA